MVFRTGARTLIGGGGGIFSYNYDIVMFIINNYDIVMFGGARSQTWHHRTLQYHNYTLITASSKPLTQYHNLT